MLSRTAYAAIPAPKDIPVDNVAEPKNNPNLDAAVVTLIIPKLILPAIANIVDAPKNNDVLNAAPTNAPEKNHSKMNLHQPQPTNLQKHLPTMPLK